MIAPPSEIQSRSQVICQPRLHRTTDEKTTTKKHSLGSQNMTNMFCKIIQDFISIGSLTGLFLNSCSDDYSAKWDTIFANAKLLTKQMGYNTN